MSRIGLIVASTSCLLLAMVLYFGGSATAALVALAVSVAFDIGFVRSLVAERRRAKEAR